MGQLAVKLKKGTIFGGLGVRKMGYSIFWGKTLALTLTDTVTVIS